MKTLSERFTLLGAVSRVMVFTLTGFLALTAQAQYTFQYGPYGGPTPFTPDAPPTDYSVDPTGIQNHQGTHGFVVHHNGTDTYVNIPGTNYAIGGLQINTAGNVAGTYNDNLGGTGGDRSFFWNGTLSVFSSPLSDPQVRDMNDLGEIVGGFRDGGSRQGFIYNHGSYSTFALHDLLPYFQYNGVTYNTFSCATVIDGVNNQGQILGNFSVNYGLNPAFWFVASPPGVPEPGSLTLLGLGALCFMRIRSRVRS